MSAITEQLAKIEESITQQCIASGRLRKEITLIAVSKTKPLYMIQEAYTAGQRHLEKTECKNSKKKLNL